MNILIDKCKNISVANNGLFDSERNNACNQNLVSSRSLATNRIHNKVRYRFLCLMFCVFMILFTACDVGTNASSTNKAKQILSTSNGNIFSYSTRPQDVLIRTFYGGGKLGTFEISPGAGTANATGKASDRCSTTITEYTGGYLRPAQVKQAAVL